VILLAGLVMIPDLLGPLGRGGSVLNPWWALCVLSQARMSSVSFPAKYFETRTLWPFGLYCLLAGPFFIGRFAWHRQP